MTHVKEVAENDLLSMASKKHPTLVNLSQKVCGHKV